MEGYSKAPNNRNGDGLSALRLLGSLSIVVLFRLITVIGCAKTGSLRLLGSPLRLLGASITLIRFRQGGVLGASWCVLRHVNLVLELWLSPAWAEYGACAANCGACAAEYNACAADCSACGAECCACAAEYSACATEYSACVQQMEPVQHIVVPAEQNTVPVQQNTVPGCWIQDP